MTGVGLSARQKGTELLSKSTLPAIYHGLMKAPRRTEIDQRFGTPRCMVCGKTCHEAPLNRHHLVWRSMGNLFDQWGRKMEKPTIMLCGSGNTGGCHKKAHDRHLHFRWVERKFAEGANPLQTDLDIMSSVGGHLEYLETDETDYQKALELDGWEPVLGD